MVVQQLMATSTIRNTTIAHNTDFRKTYREAIQTLTISQIPEIISLISMEYYRLLLDRQASDPQIQCARNRHVELLLSCAHPPIDTSSKTFFADLQQTWPSLFFSKKTIIQKFGDDEVLKDLLECRCLLCTVQRDRRRITTEAAKNAVSRSQLSDSVLVVALAVLVYLDKLQFFYRLVSFPIARIKSLDSVIKYLSSSEVLQDLIDTELGREVFEAALKHVVSMFEPEIFEVEANGFCRRHQYLDSDRFPFLDTKESTIQGAFGTVIKFLIPEEYIHPSVKRIMDGRYRMSVREVTRNSQYRFVRKVVKLNEKATLNTMEDTVAQLVAMLGEPAATNVITLLAFYAWRNSMYFVFPCLETDLYDLLRQKTVPGNIDKPTRLKGHAVRLPDHWLWQQMLGVARALSAIHNEMKGPYGKIKGRFIAAHFDLKPANILVTGEGVLKITDFGASVIRVTESLQDESTPFRPGDPKYAAPESKPTGQMLERAYNSGPEGEDYQVLLNYDVWALACVMTEVLVVLFDTEEEFLGPVDPAIDKFHRELQSASVDRRTRGTFLEGHEVKPCVRDRLQGFSEHERFRDDYPHASYIKKICDLLLDMFKSNNKDRPNSNKVLERLNQADEDYRSDVENQRDPLSWAVRQRPLRHHDRDAFQEVGWTAGGALQSFIEMDEVLLTPIEDGRTVAQDIYDRVQCRFQLFYKASEWVEIPPEPGLIAPSKTTSSSKSIRPTLNPFKNNRSTLRNKLPDWVLRPSEFILKWGISPRSMTRQGQRHKFGETRIVTSEWSFTPMYAFNFNHSFENSHFECTLFRNDTFGVDDVLRFAFRTPEHVQSFQAALLHYTVQSPVYGRPPGIIYQRSKVDIVAPRLQARKVTFSGVSGHANGSLSLPAPGLFAQVWEKAGPTFLSSGKAAELGPSNGRLDDNGSNTPNKIQPPKALIFLKGDCKMQFALPLASQVTDKVFNDSAASHGITCKFDRNRSFFSLISIPSKTRKPKQEVREFLWHSSFPLIEELFELNRSVDDSDNCEVKEVKTMELVMGDKTGYDIIKTHVQGAWGKTVK